MDGYAIAIWLWDGVEELDFAGSYEVLSSWARSSERDISVRTVAATAEAVRCSHGLRVIPDMAAAALGRVDLFVLPGGDTRPLQSDGPFLERLRALHGADQYEPQPPV